jgi:hypothetical protein
LAGIALAQTAPIYAVLFVGYLLLTAAVIGKVMYDTSKSGNDMVIEHIENPVLKVKILQGCRIVYQQF